MVNRGLTGACDCRLMSRENSGASETGLAVQADGWRRVTPSPSAEDLKAFSAGEYSQASPGTSAQAYPPAEIAHRDLLAQLLLAAVAEGRGGRGDGKLLEVGCGEGWLLSNADDAGYEVLGVDFSR